MNVHLETVNAEMESEMLDGEQAGLFRSQALHLTLYSDGQARHPICCSESPIILHVSS